MSAPTPARDGRVFIGPAGTQPGGEGWTELGPAREFTVEPVPQDADGRPVERFALAMNTISVQFQILGDALSAAWPDFRRIMLALGSGTAKQRREWRRAERRTETPKRSAMHAEYRRKNRRRNRNRQRR